MINVHVLIPPLLGTVEYWRVWQPLQVVKLMYPGVFNFTFKKKDLDFNDAWQADFVITIRPGSKPDVNQYLEKAKLNGAVVAVDIDDHILDLPRFHDLYHDYKPGSAGHKRAVKTCELADIFWFSTPKFLETYSKQGIVIPNAILPEILPAEPAPDNGIWIWRGRSIQVHDLIYAGWDWYEKIKKKPKQWRFIGFDPPLRHADNVGEGLQYITDTQEYMSRIRAARFNGFWKPMVDCSFNDHKSNIAWIEATLSGGVCLTNYAGKPGWEYATKNFPTYKQACELWEKSVKEIQEKYNLIETAKMRAQSMLQACSHRLPTLKGTGSTYPQPETP